MTRAFRHFVGRVLIGVMLFTQLAIAAYACPDLSSSAQHLQPMSGAIDASAEARSMDCDQMPGRLDPAAPNLCAEHCRHGQQSDQVQAPTVPAVVLASLYIVPAMPEAASPTRPTAAAVGLFAAAGPPLAILHCRFRD